MRTLIAVVLAGVAAAALAGCAQAGAVTDPAASPVSYPTQDVVSSIAVDPALAAELPAAQQGGALTIGIPPAPGTSGLPHAGTVGTRQIGLDVDLREAVARLLGVRWTVQDATFSTIVPAVQNGKYAVGEGNFGVTKAREQVVDYATYLTDGQSFLGRSGLGLGAVHQLTDLCGLTVATSPGSTFQQILTDGAAKCAAAGKKPYTVQLFSDVAPIILGLGNGKVDVYFGPTLSLQYDAKHIAGTTFLGQFSSTPVGYVTAKGSPLAKPLSDAVNELIANGDYGKILAKWGVTSSGIAHSEVNPAPTL